MLGNPATDSQFDNSPKIRFAHCIALISDELYEAIGVTAGNNRDMEKVQQGLTLHKRYPNYCRL